MALFLGIARGIPEPQPALVLTGYQVDNSATLSFGYNKTGAYVITLDDDAGDLYVYGKQSISYTGTLPSGLTAQLWTVDGYTLDLKISGSSVAQGSYPITVTWSVSPYTDGTNGTPGTVGGTTVFFNWWFPTTTITKTFTITVAASTITYSTVQSASWSPFEFFNNKVRTVAGTSSQLAGLVDILFGVTGSYSVTVALITGSLPPGLVIGSVIGSVYDKGVYIEGVPTSAGIFNFTLAFSWTRTTWNGDHTVIISTETGTTNVDCSITTTDPDGITLPTTFSSQLLLPSLASLNFGDEVTPLFPPDVPGSFAAVPRDAQIILSWTKPPVSSQLTAATSYRIYWGTSTGINLADSFITVTDGDTLTYTHTGRTNNTTYYYKILALSADNSVGSLSTEISAIPLSLTVDVTGVTVAPATASIEVGSTQQLTATIAPDNATTKTVRWLTSAAGIATVSPTGLVTAVAAGAATITATTVDGSFTDTTAVAVTDAIPATPATPSATAGDAQVVISWAAVSGATSYKLYWARGGSVDTNSSMIPIASGVTYTHTLLDNGFAYIYRLAAVNATGDSALSGTASATPVPPVPVAPTISAVAGNAQVTINWTSISGVSYYKLYWSTSSGITTGNSTLINALTGTSYLHTGRTNGTPYYYKMSAVNAGGEGALSTEVSATPAITEVDAIPTLFKVGAADLNTIFAGLSGKTPRADIQYKVKTSIDPAPVVYTDLSQLFAKISDKRSGASDATVTGFKVGGADLNTIFAARNSL